MPIHRRPQLAGTGPPALDRPGQVGVVLHQLCGVGAQHEPVDRNVFGLATDEDRPGVLGPGAHREEVQVRAAEGAHGRESMGRDHLGQQRAVQVGTVGERERQRRLAVQLAQRGDLVLVDEHVVGPREPAAEAAPGVHRPVVERGRHLAQVTRGLGPHAFEVTAQLGCQLLQSLLIPRRVQQLDHLGRVGRQRQPPIPR